MRGILAAILLVAGLSLAKAADTYTTRMGLTQPAIGSTGWGTKISSDMAIIDSSAAIQALSNTFSAANTFTAAVTHTNAPITLTGSSGYVTSSSSVNASAFFGNGANVTSVAAVTVPAAGVQSGTLGAAVIASSVAATGVTPGSFGTASSVPTITVGGDGRLSSASNTSIAITESQVTSLTADLASKASTGTDNSMTRANALQTLGAAQVTVISTLTVQGNAFSVGASTLVASGGKVGVGTSALNNTLSVKTTLGLQSATGNDRMTLTGSESQNTILTSAGVPILINTAAGGGVDIADSGTTLLSVRGGKVGVNQNTPITTLHVSTTSTEIARFERTGSAGGNISVYSDATHLAQFNYSFTPNSLSMGPFGHTSALTLDTNGSVVTEDGIVAVGTVTVKGNAFSVGGSTLVVTSGKVGIGGAVSPLVSTLEVLGNLHVGSQSSKNALIQNSIADPATPNYSFFAQTGSGMYMPGDSILGWSIGGTQKLALSASEFTLASTATFQNSKFSVGTSTFVVQNGQVGMGSAPSQTAVTAEIRNKANTGSVGLMMGGLASNASSYLQFTDNTTYNYGIGTDGDGSFNLYSGRNNTTAGTQRVIVTQAGNMAVGSTSANNKLSVKSTIGLQSATGNDRLTLTGSETENLISNTGSVPITIDGQGAPVYLQTTTGGKQLTAAANGFVGINNTNPLNNLDVVGPIAVRRTSNTNQVSTMTMENGNMEFAASVTGSANMVFKTAGTERMRVTNGGDVSIGNNASPFGRLNVTGGNLQVGAYTSDRAIPIASRGETDASRLAVSRTASDVEAMFIRVDGNTPSIVANAADINIGSGTGTGFGGGITVRATTANVGIGNLAPANKLSVQGTLGMTSSTGNDRLTLVTTESLATVATSAGIPLTLNTAAGGTMRLQTTGVDRGTFDSTGASLMGSTFTASSTGNIAAPSQFFVYLSSPTNQPLPDGVNEIIYWVFSSSQTQAGWVATSSATVTFTEAGRYMVSCQLQFSAAATGTFRQVSVRSIPDRNGDQTATCPVMPGGTNTLCGTIPKVMNKSVGDTTTCSATQDSGAVMYLATGQAATYFQVYKVP